MNKNSRDSKHRKLELKKETVIYLTGDLLKNAVGGSNLPSIPISECPAGCVK